MIQRFVTEIIGLVNEMSPYLLFGLLIAGLMHVFFPAKVMERYIGKKNFKSVVNASLFGIPLPLCSCGVIPTGVSLYKNGASKGSAISFLISTPQTGVDSIMVTYSLLGLPFAILRPIIAFITGITGGYFANKIEKEEYSEKSTSKNNDKCAIEYQHSNRFFRVMRYAFLTLFQDLQKWLLVGILLAGLIAIAVPDDFFSNYINNSLWGMLIMLLLAIPMYICATASVPIAAIMMLKGLSPGAALVFLMAGPATNIATLTVIAKVFGNKSVFIYLTVIIFSSLFFGLLIDNILPREWFIGGIEPMHNHSHILPEWISISSSILLGILFIIGFYQKYFRKHLLYRLKKRASITKLKSQSLNSTTIIIEGMSCNHCKQSVEDRLRSIDGIYNVVANIENKEVEIDGTFDIEVIKAAIDEIGYEFKGIKNEMETKKHVSSIKKRISIFFYSW